MQNQIEIETLNVAKENYAVAKAIVEAIEQELQKLNAPIHKLEEEEKISVEEWAEKVTANEFKLKLPQAQQILADAENALIATAKEGLKKQAAPSQWNQLECVFTDGLKFLNIREKVLDLALSWRGY